MVVAAQAQRTKFKDLDLSLGRIDQRDLLEDNVKVSGQGSEAIGLDLEDKGRPRHHVGDDSTWAQRAFVDTLWKSLGRGQDTVVPGATVHWVRYHLYIAEELKGLPLEVGIETRAAFTLYVNGTRMASDAAGPEPQGIIPAHDSLPRTLVPLTFLADGAPEVIALRLEVPTGAPLRTSGLHLTLHAPSGIYHRNRQMMHYGVFIGINVIILLLSLVLGGADRSERSWPLLGALSLISALSTWCDVAGDAAALGLPVRTTGILNILDTVLIPWPLYLLIMVLGHLRGDLSRKRARLYTISVLVVTGIALLLAVGDYYGVVDTGAGITFTETAVAFIVAVVLLGMLFGLVLAWFAIDVVRLGIKLLRSTGYERWIGGGALASSLLSILLNVLSEFSSFALGSWLSLIANYCAYVAVPVSVAVYLAIRSAHHNRLVARQRDELDAEVKERTAELRTEKERSDALLLNILPAEVAEELKAKGAADAKHFDLATVLFTDFRGFTQLSEQVGPAELVQELNACFKAFDAIMGKYRIEKIKTIGDSYMAAGGLPDPSHGGAVEVVLAALEMQDFMQQHKVERLAAGKPYFEMRVGIHSGPVVAGIVGVNKFQYDIWGDTVNTASRMESSGEVGKVNISEATYRLVVGSPLSVGGQGDGSRTTGNSQLTTPAFTFTPRGKVQAKGKGEMEMFFVHRSSTGA